MSDAQPRIDHRLAIKAGMPRVSRLRRPVGVAGDVNFATPILIIEDETMIAWMIESVLEEAGFNDIVMASSAGEALDQASRAVPGLIVSDINLGGGPDGVVTAAAIVQANFVPVIFVTAYANAETRLRVEAEVPGAILLRKPVQSASLIAAVLEALRVGPSH